MAPRKQPETLSQMQFDRPVADPPLPPTILDEKKNEMAVLIAQIRILEDQVAKLQADIFYMERHPEGVAILTRMFEDWKKKQTA